MPLRVQLFAVHKDRHPCGPMHEAANAYIARCRGFAERRYFQTELSLMDAVIESRQAGATLFWIADVRGGQMTSVEFAKHMEAVRDQGMRTLIVAIGPHSGWSAAAVASADRQLSLGPMTLPHELAMLVLAEQIYRASNILQGHPYHLGH